MSLRNHALEFRPLRGGVAIWNPQAGGVGSLGMILLDRNGDRWALSAYHVIARPAGRPIAAAEPIYQPQPRDPSSLLGHSDPARARPDLDAAAALVRADCAAVPEILGIGRLAPPVPPAINMRVIKAGQETGITEGRITGINGDSVTITRPPDFPADYDLSNIGDSGSIWLERDARAPVALHVGGNDTGDEKAFAINIRSILAALDLVPLT